MAKAKKDRGLLSHKAVNKVNEEKEYIGTLRSYPHSRATPNPVFVQSTREKYCKMVNTRRPCPQMPDWKSILSRELATA